METFRNADSIGSAASELTQRHLAMKHLTLEDNNPYLLRRCCDIYFNFQEDKWTFSMIFLAVVSLGMFHVGIQAVAILTAGVVSSNFGVSSSPNCGYWYPRAVINVSKASDQLPQYVYPHEELYESISYAESYYGTASISSTVSPYLSQRIEYQERSDASCPFDHRCCTSEDSALLMDTGYQSSTVLGINTAQQYFFRLRAVCSPLNAKDFGGTRPAMLNTTNFEDDRDKIVKQYYHAKPGESYDTMPGMLYGSCDGYKYFFRLVFG